MSNKKKYAKDHQQFKTDIENLLSRDGNKTLYLLLKSICGLILILIIWSYFAVVEEAAVGDGKVIPSGRIKHIQSLEGGIVQQILVHEGQNIIKDQPAVIIDDTQAKATFEQNKSKALSLKLKQIRLKSEIAQNSKIVWPDHYRQYANLLSVQNNLFHARMNSIRNKLKLFDKQIDLLTKEVKLKEAGRRSGSISEVELLQLKRNEIKLRIERNLSLAEYIQNANKELTDTTHELDELGYLLVAKSDKVSRTVLKSPVDGIVKTIHVSSIGQVVQGGEDVLDIVPINDHLIVEVKVSPVDIGFIAINQKATIKISAYDYSIYGGLEGKVKSISADSHTNEHGHSFYLVQVITTKNYLTKSGKKYYIIPGMIASAHILTGKKTVLQYLLKPLVKTLQNSFHER